MNYLIHFSKASTNEQIQYYLQSVNASIIRKYETFNRLYLVSSNIEPVISEIIDVVISDDDSKLQLLSSTIVSDKLPGMVKTDGSQQMIQIRKSQENWWKWYSLVGCNLDEELPYITNRRGSSAVVYIVDSGVDTDHQEFEESNIEQLFSFNNDFTDTNGHGTAIASVISGKNCGITNAKLKSVKVFDSITPTKLSDLVSAFDAVYRDYIDTQANSDYEQFIVNISWAIPKNSLIEILINKMTSSGLFFVVASGNSGHNIKDVTPSGMSSVLTVGSYNSDLMPSDFSSFASESVIKCTTNSTNYGRLDGFAPGEDIYAATLDKSYGYVHGTSMSAAIQSAALAYNFEDSKIFADSEVSLLQRKINMSMGRRGLLDISRPRYSTANNLITVFKDVDNTYTYKPLYKPTHEVSEDTDIVLYVFNPVYIHRIDILDDLPVDMIIDNLGRLSWRTPDISGDKEIIEIKTILYYIDTTSQEQTFTITIYSKTNPIEPNKINDKLNCFSIDMEKGTKI